ncbi:MAG: nucleoside hydrolase [Promethearchaeota archaeon]
MRVLVDTDPGLGYKFADVDDGLAIFLMLNNPEFEIEGFTTIFGNTPVDKGFLLLRKYLKLAKRLDIPHIKGAQSKNELGKLNDASNFLINKVKEHPKELILITLGPLTNVATALINYPDFFDDLKQIVIMGGTLSPQTEFSGLFKGIDRRFFDKIKIKEIVAEFNFYNDAKAAKTVIEAQTSTQRIEMGLDICCKAIFKDKHLKEIEEIQEPIQQFIAKHLKFWLKIWKLNGKGGFFPFDTFCPIYLLKPKLFKHVDLFLEVDAEKIEGKLKIVPKGNKKSTPISYCVNFTDIYAKKEFMKILISNLKGDL